MSVLCASHSHELALVDGAKSIPEVVSASAAKLANAPLHVGALRGRQYCD